MSKKAEFKDGDVLLLTDGKLARLKEAPKSDMSMVMAHMVDEDDYTHVTIQYHGLIKNLGQSPEVLATFYAANSIHVRLNTMKQL